MRSESWRPGLVLAVAWAAAAVAVLAVIRTCGPDSDWVGMWTSDAAIPVLMSNQARFTPFELYYWGQDRFGSLPFLLASAWHVVTGFVWTPQRLAVAMALFAFTSAWPLGHLLRPRRYWALFWCGLLL